MILWLLLGVPIVAAILAAVVGNKQAKGVAVLGLLVTLGLSLFPLITGGADPTQTATLPWLPDLKISFHLQADAPALYLVALTAFLGLMSAVFSSITITEREGQYYALLLALVGTVIGAFLAYDLILFYIFFEICLVPAYLLIGIWGGKNRIPAATKFFVYTVVGSLLMLTSIIALYLHCGTFDIAGIMEALKDNPLPPQNAVFIFGGFAAAFAVKTGLFPVHTWLPDAYAEAPAPITAFLSGAMAKLGTYGFYRFCIMLLPDASAEMAQYMVALGVISIVYGALVATSQNDAKRVIAYSSISHLGFVVAGLFALNNQGLAGAFIQNLNHGITSAGLFLAIGIIAARRGTTKLVALGGLWEQMPVYGRVLLILTLSSVGLPLTNSFVGEFMILLGTYASFPLLGVVATTGVILSAIYMLVMFQKAMYGPVDRPENRRLTDLSGTELGMFVPFIALIFLLGVLPAPVLNQMKESVNRTVSAFGVSSVAPPVLGERAVPTSEPANPAEHGAEVTNP